METYNIIYTAEKYKERLLDIILNLKTGYSNYVDKKNKIFYNCGYYNGTYTTWDCWNWHKTLWWGWTSGFNKGSFLFAPNKNGIGDWNGREILDRCYDTSSDFKKVDEVEWLLTEKEDHAGVYIGETTYKGYIFNTAECTPQTNVMEGGCCLTYTDEQGRRFNHKGGAQAGAWKYHGKMPWIDYAQGEAGMKCTVQILQGNKALVNIEGMINADIKG